jgi:hypothetical protein
LPHSPIHLFIQFFALTLIYSPKNWLHQNSTDARIVRAHKNRQFMFKELIPFPSIHSALQNFSIIFPSPSFTARLIIVDSAERFSNRPVAASNSPFTQSIHKMFPIKHITLNNSKSF